MMVSDQQIFFEEWGASYGSPYLVNESENAADAELAEPVEPFYRTPKGGAVADLAFVDGIRRAEGIVYRRGTDGVLSRGVVGAHACGAVLIGATARPSVSHVRVKRMLIMGSGRPWPAPATQGYSWAPFAIQSEEPDAPLRDLQNRMRRSEAALAQQLCSEGWLTIIDGPLNFVRTDEPVVGYVKTHLQRRLPLALHLRVPDLGIGQRTPLFTARETYSCYLRLAAPPRFANPWGGVVRLELPESRGVDEAANRADQAALTLPRFAGLPHKDPRAPQNLLPIGVMERQLRHRLGPMDRAARAIRLAVAASSSPSSILSPTA